MMVKAVAGKEKKKKEKKKLLLGLLRFLITGNIMT